MSSPGNAGGETQGTLRALLKPCFLPNVKFIVLLKSYNILGMIYFHSIKVIVW